MVNLKTTLRQVGSRQGPCFSIRVVVGIFWSDSDTDTVFAQLNQYLQMLRLCCLVGSEYGSMIALLPWDAMQLATMNEIKKEKIQS